MCDDCDDESIMKLDNFGFEKLQVGRNFDISTFYRYGMLIKNCHDLSFEEAIKKTKIKNEY